LHQDARCIVLFMFDPLGREFPWLKLIRGVVGRTIN
jgi:hypothetical protein